MPEEAATVTVSDFAPTVVGLKAMVPVVQVPLIASALLAVQVPSGAVKSVPSELLNGVAPNVTGPPTAVKVMEPAPQVVETPEPIVPQANEVGLALNVPAVPVPEIV